MPADEKDYARPSLLAVAFLKRIKVCIIYRDDYARLINHRGDDV